MFHPGPYQLSHIIIPDFWLVVVIDAVVWVVNVSVVGFEVSQK